MYTPAISRPQIAGLSALVTQVARAGDPVALGLLNKAGRDLADTAIAVMVQLNVLETGMNVFTTGGVFKAGTLIMNSFRETLQSRSPVSQVAEAAFSPIVGGLFLALQAAGSSLDDSVLKAISDTLPAVAASKHQDEPNE